MTKIEDEYSGYQGSGKRIQRLVELDLSRWIFEGLQRSICFLPNGSCFTSKEWIMDQRIDDNT